MMSSYLYEAFTIIKNEFSAIFKIKFIPFYLTDEDNIFPDLYLNWNYPYELSQFLLILPMRFVHSHLLLLSNPF